MAETFRPRNVLVTGGAGFVGSNFIRLLLSNYPEAHVVTLDLLSHAGSLKNLEQLPSPLQHTFVQGDICDTGLVKELLYKHEIDTIVHFAAERHKDRSSDAPMAFIQTNLVGTFTLLEAARRYWIIDGNGTNVRFHHVSTDQVYGDLGKDTKPFDEKNAYLPKSPYSASKAGSDHLARAYYATYGLPVTISHCSNNYGPYQQPEKFIPSLIRACLRWEPIPIFGNGTNIRDWIYVEDHCRGIMTILEKGKLGETYHLGGNLELSNLELAKRIATFMDEVSPRKKSHKELISFVMDRPAHDWRYAMDTTKIQTQLGWEPRETFSSGFKKTLDFYKKESVNSQSNYDTIPQLSWVKTQG